MLKVLGVNHNTASVDIRERVAFDPEVIGRALIDARAGCESDGVAILSTCNRTELYIESSRPTETHLRWLADWHGLPRDEIESVCYTHKNLEAAKHLMKVASGLDSMVLGEPQILGQLKSAYAVAEQTGTLNSQLHHAFHSAFGVAKRVRTETAIGKHPVSVAYAAVSLAKRVFSDLSSKTALLIGAGDTIRLAAQHLADRGVRRFIVANRTPVNAQFLSMDMDVEPIMLADIPNYLHRADICISSTASKLPILGKGAIETALRERKHRIMFMVDTAVPRDIESEVGDLDDVYLFNVDDLADVIQENRRLREEAAEQAFEIITEGTQLWQRERRVSENAHLIRLYRERAEQMRDKELQRALKALGSGADPQQTMLEFSHSLTNKLIHAPTVQLGRIKETDREDLFPWGSEIPQADNRDDTDDLDQ